MNPDIIKSTSVTKFIIKEKPLYAKVIWKNDEDDLFHLKIFDDDVTWSGKYSNESAKKYRDRTEETETQYNKNVLRYLRESVRNECTYDFVRDENDPDLAVFTWKKRFEESEGAVFLVHGSLSLHRDKSVASKDLLLDFLLEENQELKTTIESINKKNLTITSDLKKCKTELEKFVDIKTSLESSLYGKFVQLLNAKKRRIQVLESNLHTLTDELGGDH